MEAIKLNLRSSDFELFGLPERFAQELDRVDQRWRELQQEVHPDRFAAQGDSAQRVAMQYSIRVNEAYRRLRDPLKRAAYLCEMRGAPIEAESNTAMPAEFLMEQMEWRESLDEAQTDSELEALRSRLQQARNATLARIAELLDRAGDAPASARQVRALMFIERFAHDVEARFEQLGQ